MSQSEFSRAVRVDTLGSAPRHLSIGANEEERVALARRFGLVSIDHLSAETDISRNGEEVVSRGTLSARVTQSCVATSDPVEAEVEEAFEIHFRPQPARALEEDEIELSEGELDVVFYDGASIDVGESVAETLSLSLDPYPRIPDAETVLRDAGIKSEEEARLESSPFAALKGKLQQ